MATNRFEGRLGVDGILAAGRSLGDCFSVLTVAAVVSVTSSIGRSDRENSDGGPLKGTSHSTGDATTVWGEAYTSADIVAAGLTKMLLGLQQPSSETEGEDIGIEDVWCIAEVTY